MRRARLLVDYLSSALLESRAYFIGKKSTKTVIQTLCGICEFGFKVDLRWSDDLCRLLVRTPQAWTSFNAQMGLGREALFAKIEVFLAAGFDEGGAVLFRQVFEHLAQLCADLLDNLIAGALGAAFGL